MQTIRITTSQNIDIDYEIASIGDRILAKLIDSAIFVLIFIAGILTGLAFGPYFKEVMYGIIAIAFFVLYVFYDLICEIFMNGQSVGKRVMKIKVISLDGGQATIGQYILRWLFRIVDFALTGSVCAIIAVAVTEKSQRVGDIVAGTTLIKTEARTKIGALAFMPEGNEYVPVFNEATMLTDKDIVLVHEVIASYFKSGNTVVIFNTAAKLKQFLNIHTQMDDLQFLQTLIKDYNHLTTAAETT